MPGAMLHLRHLLFSVLCRLPVKRLVKHLLCHTCQMGTRVNIQQTELIQVVLDLIEMHSINMFSNVGIRDLSSC